MSQVKWWVAVMVMAMMGAAFPALAAENGSQTPAVSAGNGSSDMLIRSDKFIGARVQNSSGEKLGTIHDIVLGPGHRMVLYAVLSHGGAMGIGEKYFAVPWQSLTPTLQEQGKVDFVTLNISKDELDKAQGFDHKNWPDRPDTTLFKTQISERRGERLILGRETEMREGGIMKYQKVSEINGLDVKNDRNESLGDVSFLLIGPKGLVRFAAISHGGFLGAGEKYSAVPWQAIRLDTSRDLALLNVDKKLLEENSFVEKDYPNFSDRQYTMKLYQLYKVEPGSVTARETTMNFDAWKEGSDYNKHFDSSKVTTLEGTVQEVGQFTVSEGAAPGLMIMLKTDKGEMMTVHGGPLAFSESKNFKLASGDKISVTGCQVSMEGKTVLMAGEIKKGGETLLLRDKDGKIQWDVTTLQDHSGHEMKNEK